MRGVDQVTRIRLTQTGVDRYDIPVYEVVETEIAELALFAPKDVIPAAEAGREPIVVEPTLYWFEHWPDIVAADRVRVRGVEYAVTAVPADWRSATVGGLVVKLRETAEGVP